MSHKCKGRTDYCGNTIECKEILDIQWIELNGKKCIDCMHDDYIDDLIG